MASSRVLIVTILALLVACSLGQNPGSCSYYCNTIFNQTFTNTCTAGSAYLGQPDFASTAACMAWCALVNVAGGIGNGTDQDSSGQTLGCRIYYALQAMQNGPGWNDYCDYAAMMGGDQCGTYCDSYCINAQYGPCVGSYQSAATCQTACGYMPTSLTAGHDITANVPANWQNSVQCRMYHGGGPSINSISPGNSSVHCPHQWVTGGNACPPNDYCTGYCQLYVGACSSGGYLEVGVTDMSSCLSKCTNAFPITNPAPAYAPAQYIVTTNPPSGNTIDCRSYHVLNAINTGQYSVHCPHAWVAASAGTPCNPASTSDAFIAVPTFALLVALLFLFIY